MLPAQLRFLQRFVGKPALIWTFIGVLAGSLASFVELLISVQIANLLVILGLNSERIHLPFGLERLPQSPAVFAGIFIALGITRGLMQFCISHSGTFSHEAIETRLRLLAYYESFCSKRAYTSLATLGSRTGDLFPKTAQFCMSFALFVPTVLQTLIFMAILAHQALVPTALGIGSIGIAVSRRSFCCSYSLWSRRA